MRLVGVALERGPVAERALFEWEGDAIRVGTLVAAEVVGPLVSFELVVLLERLVAAGVRARERVGPGGAVRLGEVNAEVIVLPELFAAHLALNRGREACELAVGRDPHGQPGQPESSGDSGQGQGVCVACGVGRLLTS